MAQRQIAQKLLQTIMVLAIVWAVGLTILAFAFTGQDEPHASKDMQLVDSVGFVEDVRSEDVPDKLRLGWHVATAAEVQHDREWRQRARQNDQMFVLALAWGPLALFLIARAWGRWLVKPVG